MKDTVVLRPIRHIDVEVDNPVLAEPVIQAAKTHLADRYTDVPNLRYVVIVKCFGTESEVSGA